MAPASQEFTKYTVYYISGHSPAVGVPQCAEIDCFTSTNQRAGALYFYPDGVPLPANNKNVNGIYLYFHQSRFADALRLLQSEKPLYLNLDVANGSGYVSTAFEPIGEQEGV